MRANGSTLTSWAIVKIREIRFSAEELLSAIATLKPVPGVRPESVNRNLTCAGCGSAMEPINYGCTTGLILDRCTGFWLDDAELEKVQILVEGWEAALPGDLQEFGAKLRQIEVDWDEEDDVHPSRIPVVGQFINICINGILDLTLKV